MSHPKSSHRVQEVVRIANAVGREYDREYVGTEHVLLAIQREGTGLGAAILQKNGITPAKLQGAINHLVQKSMEETWVFGRLPGTPHFRNVMAAAIEECLDLGAKEVCTEHLLVALLREKGSVAYKALQQLGLTYEKAREQVQAAGGAPEKKG